MARDLGPDMLRNLEAQLEAGRIDQATYDGRRAEVLELIRTGKAVEYTGAERARTAIFGRWLPGLFALLIGVVVIGGGAANGSVTPLGGVVGLVFIGLGLWFLFRRR